MIETLRVAVADDEPVMQMYLEETVRGLGHDVVAVAADGQELIQACRDQHPDLVISDIKMPHVDGLQAAHAICQERVLPFLFVTGYADQERSAMAGNRCVLAFLVKPVGENELRQGIDLVMAKFRQFREILREVGDNPAKAAEARRLIETAVDRLMETHNLSSIQAHLRLAELHQQDGGTLLNVARDIVAEAG